MKLDIASRAAWVLLSVAMVTLFWRHELFATNALAIGVQVFAGCLWVWARLTFGNRSFHGGAEPTEGPMVTAGPYRFARHPIYAALLYFTLAGAASHLSIVSAACASVAIGAVAVRVWAEERFLRERYPEYTAYAARTKRFVPFVL